MNKREKLFCMISTILVLASLLLMVIARNVSGFADWYQLHIYRKQAAFWSGLYGTLPFSAFEMGICILIPVVLMRIGKVVITYKKNGQTQGIILKEIVFYWCVASALFFLFVVHSGINYSAASFSEQYALEREGYTLEELTEVCERLAEEVCTLSGQVERSADGLFLEPEDGGALAVEAMERLGSIYEGLAGEYPLPKAVLNSWILSYEQLTGIYSPFTMEANYNQEMTAYNIPFTMCHELSHLKGYMREDEANFIAWLACRSTEEVSFQYSGALMGWIYCGNELYKYDKETYWELRSYLPEEVHIDLLANTEYWNAHEGVVADVSETVNDTYLKVNQQEMGILTYDRVVDLIVNDLLEE